MTSPVVSLVNEVGGAFFIAPENALCICKLIQASRSKAGTSCHGDKSAETEEFSDKDSKLVYLLTALIAKLAMHQDQLKNFFGEVVGC